MIFDNLLLESGYFYDKNEILYRVREEHKWKKR